MRRRPRPRITEIAGSCSSVAPRHCSAAGPLSRTRSPLVGCVAVTLLIDALREVAGDLRRRRGRRQSAREERVQRLEARLCCCVGRCGRPQREEPGASLHRPAHRLGLAVGHHELRRRSSRRRRCSPPSRRRAPRGRAGSAGRHASSRAWAARRVYRTVATTSTRSPSVSVPASSWFGSPEHGDRALLARELGEDAALREPAELAQRDLLALVDRIGGDERRQRRRAHDRARDDRAAGHRLGLQVAAARDRRPSVPAGMSREATRTFTRPAPSVTLLR